MKNILPIRLTWAREVLDKDIEAVAKGIGKVLKIAGVKQAVEIQRKGYWFKKPSVVGEEREYGSTKWYLELAKEKSTKPKQLAADAIVHAFRANDETGASFYDVLVTDQDLYAQGADFIVGIAQRRHGAVISPYRFSNLSAFWRMQCIITETMHEVGHVFNMPSRTSPNVEQSLGKHCTSVCIMRQGLKVPKDWVQMSKDRISEKALCFECRKELRKFFDTWPKSPRRSG